MFLIKQTSRYFLLLCDLVCIFNERKEGMKAEHKNLKLSQRDSCLPSRNCCPEPLYITTSLCLI